MEQQSELEQYINICKRIIEQLIESGATPDELFKTPPIIT